MNKFDEEPYDYQNFIHSIIGKPESPKLIESQEKKAKEVMTLEKIFLGSCFPDSCTHSKYYLD